MGTGLQPGVPQCCSQPILLHRCQPALWHRRVERRPAPEHEARAPAVAAAAAGRAQGARRAVLVGRSRPTRGQRRLNKKAWSACLLAAWQAPSAAQRCRAGVTPAAAGLGVPLLCPFYFILPIGYLLFQPLIPSYSLQLTEQCTALDHSFGACCPPATLAPPTRIQAPNRSSPSPFFIITN